MPGQQFDRYARGTTANSGLYYLRSRYYDPGLGRFLTRDPIAMQFTNTPVKPGQVPAVSGPQPPSVDEAAPRTGTPKAVTSTQTLNPYGYGVNNPANETDPSGHCSSGLWSFCGMFTLNSSISYGGVSVPILLLAGVDTISCTYVECLQLYNNPQPNGGLTLPRFSGQFAS